MTTTPGPLPTEVLVTARKLGNRRRGTYLIEAASIPGCIKARSFRVDPLRGFSYVGPWHVHQVRTFEDVVQATDPTQVAR